MTSLRESGAFGWAEDPFTVVAVTALLGFYMVEAVGDGPSTNVSREDFIRTLADAAVAFRSAARP